MWSIVEFYGDNDGADDRPLGKNGRFLEGSFNQDEVAVFPTRKAAALACASAFGMRDTGQLGLVQVVT